MTTEGTVCWNARRLVAVGLVVIAVGASSCGGGGGGLSRRDVFYVRALAGDDANGGTAIDDALRTIQAALDRSTDGDTVIVGPGTYRESVTVSVSGTSQQPIIILADASGGTTGDLPGSVLVDASPSGQFAGFHLRDVGYVTVDGFRITGASGANAGGIVVRNRSRQITIQNCEVFGNNGDGIRVQDSNDVLLFNNLVHHNSARGIAFVGTASGAQRARAINNTVADNGRRGLDIGTGSRASRDVFLRNNIIENNDPENLRVATGPPSSLDGYSGQFNLVFPDTYNPPTLPRANDVNLSASFGANYRLSASSPAIDAGSTDLSSMPSGGPAVDFASLRQRSAVEGQAGDGGRLDLGFHASN